MLRFLEGQGVTLMPMLAELFDTLIVRNGMIGDAVSWPTPERGKPANNLPSQKSIVYRQKSFDESKHPRDDSGKFGEGSGGGAAKPSKPENKLAKPSHAQAEQAAVRLGAKEFSKWGERMLGVALTGSKTDMLKQAKQHIDSQVERPKQSETTAGTKPANNLPKSSEKSEAGKSRKEQIKVLSDFIGAGGGDLNGLHKAGPPEGLDMGDFSKQVKDAIAAHEATGRVALPADKLYEQVGQGMPKRDFMRALTAMQDSDEFGAGSWSKMADDIPDPELVTNQGSRLRWYYSLSDKGKKSYRQKSKDASGHEHSAAVSGKPANNLPKSQGPAEQKSVCPIRKTAVWRGILIKGDKGRWITIGGKKGEGGKRSGGSPVYVENGRITRGAPSLAGRKIAALKEKPEARPELTGNKRQQAGQKAGQQRQENESARGYSRAKWGKQAKEQGHKAQHLHQLAAEFMAHDKAHKDDVTSMLQHVRKTHPHMRALTAQGAFGRIDASNVKMLDDIADELSHSKQWGHVFPKDADPEHHLFDLLTAGNPEHMSEDEAYESALEELNRSKASEANYQPDDEEPIPF